MHDPAMLLYVLSGFCVGALVGLTGVGGGSLMTPVLILLFGAHPAAAVGTDLLYAAVTKTGGTLIHGLSGTVRWRVVARLASGSVPATAATLFVLSRISLTEAGGARLVSTVLGSALLLTAIVLVFRSQVEDWYRRHIGELSERRTRWLTVLAGASLGVLVSISSVGAGALGVTMLVLLYPRLPIGQIVGSDIAHAVPLTLLAGIGHWLIGSVDLGIIGWLVTGSLPGIVAGSTLAVRTPERVVRFTLAAVLVIVGCRLVLESDIRSRGMALFGASGIKRLGYQRIGIRPVAGIETAGVQTGPSSAIHSRLPAPQAAAHVARCRRFPAW